MVTLASIGNIIEAAADLGGMGAALNLLVPIPIPIIVLGTAAIIFGIQYFGSYTLIRRIFRWLALVLFAYVAAAILATPDPLEVVRNTFIPRVQFNAEFLSLLVACIGTSLTAYIQNWRSTQEVDKDIARGRDTQSE